MRFIYVFYEGRGALQLRIAGCGMTPSDWLKGKIVENGQCLSLVTFNVLTF
jgi:hypothetical protein